MLIIKLNSEWRNQAFLCPPLGWFPSTLVREGAKKKTRPCRRYVLGEGGGDDPLPLKKYTFFQPKCKKHPACTEKPFLFKPFICIVNPVREYKEKDILFSIEKGWVLIKRFYCVFSECIFLIRVFPPF